MTGARRPILGRTIEAMLALALSAQGDVAAAVDLASACEPDAMADPVCLPLPVDTLLDLDEVWRAGEIVRATAASIQETGVRASYLQRTSVVQRWRTRTATDGARTTAL